MKGSQNLIVWPSSSPFSFNAFVKEKKIKIVINYLCIILKTKGYLFTDHHFPFFSSRGLER